MRAGGEFECIKWSSKFLFASLDALYPIQNVLPSFVGYRSVIEMLEVKIREFVCNFNIVLEEISLSKQNLSMPLDCMKNRKFDIGLVIERIQDSISEEDKRLIYLGDGSGDYCPSLRLKEKDFMMPRKNFPMWDLICRDPSLLKAEFHGWRLFSLHFLLLQASDSVRHCS
ncbi:uncharacterized protein LOC108332078 isoform X2 [Vigna angularis]|uniref:uncharacterized protein LOC108332078 isoform X2 n=1 Tax=Phaseolus angularis TaxID=3914 RepID=UPI0022B5B397|nr:uncharacterized protein LOC108332078 isoform X2 [Vigna angularis]XP_052732194.1 uncharacterized protein LOC108332078 isoform X2 [Vigna angularis]XP_052732195.1 uncharacterized protein LOC108332078 isoform X2 [Vigna angularis]